MPVAPMLLRQTKDQASVPDARWQPQTACLGATVGRRRTVGPHFLTETVSPSTAVNQETITPRVVTAPGRPDHRAGPPNRQASAGAGAREYLTTRSLWSLMMCA